MSDEKNLGGRPKGMTQEIAETKKAYDQLKKILRDRKVKNMDAIALNELNYHFNRFGLSPFDEAKKAYENTKITTGFEMAILGLYKKAATGDLNALQLLLKFAGGLVEKVDHTSSDGSMSPNSLSPDQARKVAEAILKTQEDPKPENE